MMRIGKLAALGVIIITAFVAGVWFKGEKVRNPNNSTAAQENPGYNCPMHPQYTSDKPGNCPSCGMRLVEKEEENSQLSHASLILPERSRSTIQISPEKQQLIGIRTSKVGKYSGSRTIRVLGRVGVDETRIYQVNAAITGWIRDVYPNTVGSLVRKNQPLASFYAPEFVGPQQAYIYALSALERFQNSGRETPDQINLTKTNVQQAADNLRNMGMGDIQIEEMRQTRESTQRINIYSPADGFVLTRNVSPGLRFGAGTELYRIADMSHVWILADIFENEAYFFRPGMRASVSYPLQRITIPARVSNVLPQFDTVTRTLKVRLEAENPEFALRPDMFVDVEFPIAFTPTLTVPSDAVLDTGLRRTVFVDLGGGYFEPRRVETGWRHGGMIEIVKGLTEGERIVVSGNFLIDSESRFKSGSMPFEDGDEEETDMRPEHQTMGPGHSAAGSGAAEKIIDPICAMTVSPDSPGTLKSVYRGITYYFCSPMCKKAFEKDPARYAVKQLESQKT